MKIEVGMKCKQIKAIEKYGFDCIGMEFEITKIDDNVIMCMGNGIGFGIDPNEFENYFEIVKEKVKEKGKEDCIMNTNYKGKKIRIINTEGFIRDDYKDLDKYIGQTGIVRWDFEGSEHRLSIKFDNEVLDSINESNGRLCFRVDSVKFIDDTCERNIDKDNKNKTLDINDIKIGQKYRVIKNRDTRYGSCRDLIEIESQEVEIMGLNVGVNGDIRIKSKNNIHICRVENLDKINSYAKLGDIVELSNGLKMKICEDENINGYYKTVDIFTNKNITTYISENKLKEYYLGNKVWGYDAYKYEIINIKTEEIKKETKSVKTNKVYFYKMIPHKINWEITHDDEIINQTTDSGDESYKLIINGLTTIVILDDGCKGVAKCLPSDEYDMDKGVDIAYTKALIKSYQKKLKRLVK